MATANPFPTICARSLARKQQVSLSLLEDWLLRRRKMDQRNGLARRHDFRTGRPVEVKPPTLPPGLMATLHCQCKLLQIRPHQLIVQTCQQRCSHLPEIQGPPWTLSLSVAPTRSQK